MNIFTVGHIYRETILTLNSRLFFSLVRRHTLTDFNIVTKFTQSRAVVEPFNKNKQAVYDIRDLENNELNGIKAAGTHTNPVATFTELIFPIAFISGMSAPCR